MSEQGKWEREKGIFTSFLAAQPNFAGGLTKKWSHVKELSQAQHDSPDIICIDNRDRLIGVEMTEWLHQEQTHAYSRWNRLLKSVEPLPGWTVQVLLEVFTKDYDKKDRQVFIDELSRTIVRSATRAEISPSGWSKFTVDRPTLAREAPTVARCCKGIVGNKIGSGRITLVAADGSYSSLDSAESLRARIRRKTDNAAYAETKRKMKLAELFLLVYYDWAIVKNTPNDIDVLAIGSAIMAGSPGAFDGGFVLMFGRCYRICPS
jgi:hypothetical protein